MKYSLGKIPLPKSVDQSIPQQRERHGISTLALEEAATAHLPILTPDPLITQYAVRTAW